MDAVPPAAVIFDCDGLLVDSETAWTRAERIIYARHGVDFTDAHKRELIGTAGPVAQATIERHLGLRPGAGKRLAAELYELALVEIERHAPPMPGAVELVERLRAEGIPVGLASNSSPALIRGALRGAGLEGAFAAVVSGFEVPRGKPAPDVYLEACRLLDADPRRSVALEDSPTGAAAARAAGMFVIGVPSIEGIELAAASLIADALHAPEVHDALGLRLAA